MKKVLSIIGICCLFLILDNALIPFLGIRGAYPSLLFIFAICYSMISGTEEAIIIGSVTGILQDAYFISGIGINAFSNLICCLLAAEVGKKIFKEKSFIPIISCFFISFIKGIFIFCLLFLVKEHSNILKIIYTSIYNTFISIFAYKFIYKLSEKSYMKKRWKF